MVRQLNCVSSRTQLQPPLPDEKHKRNDKGHSHRWHFRRGSFVGHVAQRRFGVAHSRSPTRRDTNICLCGSDYGRLKRFMRQGDGGVERLPASQIGGCIFDREPCTIMGNHRVVRDWPRFRRIPASPAGTPTRARWASPPTDDRTLTASTLATFFFDDLRLDIENELITMRGT